MIIWGKVVGAILGIILFGPIGGVLGIVFGQIFDNGLKSILSDTGHSYEARAAFFKAVFQTMGYLAKVDGVVSVNEIKVAREIMLQDFKLNEEQIQRAIEYFNEGKQADFDLDATLTEFNNICGQYMELRRFFLELQIKSAMADHILHSTGRDRLIYICQKLDLPLTELEYQLNAYGYYSSQQYSNNSYRRNYYQDSHEHHYTNTQSPPMRDDSLDAAYRLLGVSKQDNIKTVKSAYRRLISRYHPDKLVAKGLPPEMMNTAKEKTQQLTVAYDLIVRSRA